MELGFGNMFDSAGDRDAVFATGNSFIRRDGRLVMGAGAALQMAKRWRQAPWLFGQKVKASCGNLGRYGILAHELDSRWIGLFQTKISYSGQSTIDIIRFSTDKLIEWASEHDDIMIHVNYPGIGLGRLSVNDVYPIIEELPDNVVVWSI